VAVQSTEQEPHWFLQYKCSMACSEKYEPHREILKMLLASFAASSSWEVGDWINSQKERGARRRVSFVGRAGKQWPSIRNKSGAGLWQ